MIRRLVFSTLAFLASAGAAALSLDSSIADVTELFPVEPGVNTERGFAVAIAGDWLAMGARLDDEKGEDAGAVYLFHWSGTAWEQKSKLFADPPEAHAQFGLSVALRGDVLAVGAPGEGAVHLFEQDESGWAPKLRWPAAPASIPGLGRAVALGDGALAVGAGDGHGEVPAAVYVLRAPAWDLEQTIPQVQAGERFGSALALAGDTLVVGAPGHDLGPQGVDAGAAYVFERQAGVWGQTSLLRAQDGGSPLAWDPAASQFGFAVATDGLQIVVGSPTADAAGENAGAAFRFERGVGGWIGRGLLETDLQPGDQLGFSVAVSGDLIVVGSPAPPPAARSNGASAAPAASRRPEVRVFRRSGASYSEVPELESRNTPRNSEPRDLEGFAVAASGSRLVTGAPLGDQGGGAAGAAWTFVCSDGECEKDFEAVARDPGTESRFGVSVALTEMPAAADLPSAFIAVGTPPALVLDLGTVADKAFSNDAAQVHVYRRAREGWRQEALLRSPDPFDGFGSSVALAGPLLAVGAPAGRAEVSPHIGSLGGVVDLYVRHAGFERWRFERTLIPPEPVPEDRFGTSLALGDGVLAVGAPGENAVYVFEKDPSGWTRTATLTPTDSEFVEGFGSAVSLFGNVLAIGAPGTDVGGAVYASSRSSAGWGAPVRVSSPVVNQERLGTSVAADNATIIAGAPGLEDGKGAIYAFVLGPNGWYLAPSEVGDPKQRFGTSVALLGDRLVVGANGQGPVDEPEPGHAFLLERRDGAWERSETVNAVAPEPGDDFGSAVALSRNFFVVTSPLPFPFRTPRITVFDLVDPPTEPSTP